ncbi:MAG: B12-binding domain-containing radical SAM protein [Thermodesulfobacteriota bacterium]
MKIQLIVPPAGYVAGRWAGNVSMPPLGLLSLAAVLEQNGMQVEIVASDVLRCSWSGIKRRIQAFQPNIVGVTVTTENRFDAFRLIRIAKKAGPGIITVLGGPHITMTGGETLEHVTAADILALGEGEQTLVELARALESGKSLSTVSGICFRNPDGTIVFTGRRPAIESLDNLPMPARHLVPLEKYNFFVTTRGVRRKAASMVTSRGCPFGCYFCSTPVSWGRKVRALSPDRVAAEIKWLIDEYGTEFIWFYDDTFNHDTARLCAIMDRMIEKRLPVRFACELRIDTLDRAVVNKMKQAGLELAFFGVESGSDRVRRKIAGKPFSIEKAREFVRWSVEMDFIPAPFFIFSHHTETWDEARQTLAVMKEMAAINPLADISASILHVYPGTPLEAIARKEGVIPADFSWSRPSDMKRVPCLPAAQGHVPLFKDRLTWWQIATLTAEWSRVCGKQIGRSKIRRALSPDGGIKTVAVGGIFGLAFLYQRVQQWIGK